MSTGFDFNRQRGTPMLVGNVWGRGELRWTIGDGPIPDWVPMTDARRAEHERWMRRVDERGFDDGAA